MSRAPIKAINSQFLQKNAVRDGVQSFAEVQAENNHSLYLIHLMGHLVTEGIRWVSWHFPKFMLTGPDPWVETHVPSG